MNSERKDERDARQEQRQEQRQDTAPAPPASYPLPPVPQHDFTSVQQIVFTEGEVRGTEPQARRCTGKDPGGTNSKSYTGINFTQPNALCVVIPIPADLEEGAHGWVTCYEYGTAPKKRYGSFSKTPFDWAGIPGWPQTVFKDNMYPKFDLKIGSGKPDPASTAMFVEAGQTYYFNIANHDPTVEKANHGEGWDDLRDVGVELSAIHKY